MIPQMNLENFPIRLEFRVCPPEGRGTDVCFRIVVRRAWAVGSIKGKEKEPGNFTAGCSSDL